MIENTPLSGGSHLLRIASEDAKRDRPITRPGQFVQMLAHPSVHLVRRPMSIHDEGDGWRTFMVKPVGPASTELVRLRAGEEIDVSPPLGRGFPEPDELENVDSRQPRFLLVGGGFGIAPLHFLARVLDGRSKPPDYKILYGGRTARDVELDVVQGLKGPVLPSTDDGSLGFRGTCVELAQEEIRAAGSAMDEIVVLTCGSHAMMEALHHALHGRVRVIYAALEEIMACGVGVCMGCVVRTARGPVPICTEGPVFETDQVFGVEVEVKRA